MIRHHTALHRPELHAGDIITIIMPKGTSAARAIGLCRVFAQILFDAGRKFGAVRVGVQQ